jgi:hypothetical protein
MKLLQFIFIAVLFLACRDHLKLHFESPESLKKTNGFAKEFPKIRTGEISIVVDDIKYAKHELNLTEIENGVDSAEIRIWYIYSRNDTAQLNIFQNRDGEWLGNAYNFIVEDEGDSTNYIIEEKIDLIPLIGWERFMKRLLDLRITTLPHYNVIPGYKEVMHADIVLIEVATKKFYRMYYYPVPLLNTHIPEADNINQILQYIEKETKFNRIGNL